MLRNTLTKKYCASTMVPYGSLLDGNLVETAQTLSHFQSKKKVTGENIQEAYLPSETDIFLLFYFICILTTS